MISAVSLSKVSSKVPFVRSGESALAKSKVPTIRMVPVIVIVLVVAIIVGGYIIYKGLEGQTWDRYDQNDRNITGSGPDVGYDNGF